MKTGTSLGQQISAFKKSFPSVHSSPSPKASSLQFQKLSLREALYYTQKGIFFLCSGIADVCSISAMFKHKPGSHNKKSCLPLYGFFLNIFLTSLQNRNDGSGNSECLNNAASTSSVFTPSELQNSLDLILIRGVCGSFWLSLN